jgi:hypothetical protein
MIFMHIYLDFVDHSIVEVYNEYCVKDVHDRHSKVVYYPIDPSISKVLIVYLNDGFKDMLIKYKS